MLSSGFLFLLEDTAMNFRKASEKGQGLVEYGMILILVAVIVIVVVFLLGPAVGNMYSQITAGI
jgi:pilus assembly protein Flp/PilA